jgi:hypothetical protein
MQLCSAALQHVSSVLQHVVPVLPQHRRALMANLKATITTILMLGQDMVVGVCNWKTHTELQATSQQPLCSTAASLDAQAQQRLQQLLLSPHCMPFLASFMLLTVSWYTRMRLQAAKDSTQATVGTSGSASSNGGHSSRGGSSSSCGSRSSSSSETGSRAQQLGAQQRLPAHAAASSNRDAAQHQVGDGSISLSPCQQQLFELLGLSSQLVGMMPQHVILPRDGQADNLGQTTVTVLACGCCCDALRNLIAAPGTQLQQVGGDTQRWRFEQQLLLLLPSVLLPCADSLLPPGTGPQPQAWKSTDQWQGDDTNHLANAMLLLTLCSNALIVSNSIQHSYGDAWGEYRLPHPDWVTEVLCGLLQLADQLLLEQQQQQGLAASSALAGQPQQGGSITSSASSSGSNLAVQADVAQALLGLLLPSLRVFASTRSNSSTASPLHVGSSADTAACDVAGTAAVSTLSAAVPGLFNGFARFHTTIEAGLRKVTTAVQHGVLQRPSRPLWCHLQRLTGHSDDGGTPAPSLLGLNWGSCTACSHMWA